MNKLIIKIVEFFKKGHTIKYVIVTALSAIAIAVSIYLAVNDVVSNIFGAAIGFLSSSLLLYGFKIAGAKFEDLLKINYDTEELLNMYKGNGKDGKESPYRQSLEKNETSVEFAYAPVVENAKGLKFEVKDNPEKQFQLDEFIAGNYAQLFSAHSNSAKRNFDTVRLDDFDKETNTFYVSRSTYFNHLVTNRAIDFLLFDEVCLRNVLEYGPFISSLSKSKMSNHIGINALVFLSDNRLLLPRRKANATISKNKITSSIAIMLDLPASGEVTAEYLLKENIKNNLSKRLKIRKETVEKLKYDIEFLGFGQNIYEGGKPQFYFAVDLKDFDTSQYFAERKAFLKAARKNKEMDNLDVDKCIYAADYNTFKYKKDKVKFTAYNKRSKANKIKVGYERSFLCNLWHYEKN